MSWSSGDKEGSGALNAKLSGQAPSRECEVPSPGGQGRETGSGVCFGSRSVELQNPYAGYITAWETWNSGGGGILHLTALEKPAKPPMCYNKACRR